MLWLFSISALVLACALPTKVAAQTSEQKLHFRDLGEACVNRAYRELGPTGAPLPALRVETAFQACATEEQLFRRVMGDLSSAEMVISVPKSRIKQSLLSAPKPAAFRVGMKLRCPGSIENGQASVRGAVVTHVEVRQNSVRVTSTDIPLDR